MNTLEQTAITIKGVTMAIHVGYLTTEYGTVAITPAGVSYNGASLGILKKIIASYKQGAESEAETVQGLPDRLHNWFWAYDDTKQKQEDEFSRKFNPYHSQATGQFTSGGVQGKLPGMARNRPGAYTDPIHPPAFPTDRASIEAYMRKQYPNTDFNFDGISDRMAGQIASEVHTHMVEHPTLQKSLMFVGTNTGVPSDIRQSFLNNRYRSIESALGDGGMAMTSQMQGKQFIVFSAKELSDMGAFELKAEGMQQRGWFRPLKKGVSPAAYITRHELGHALLNDYLQSPQGNQFTLKHWLKEHEAQAKKTSGYGFAGGITEAVAEGYAQVPYAQKPSSFAKSVHRFLEEAGI